MRHTAKQTRNIFICLLLLGLGRPEAAVPGQNDGPAAAEKTLGIEKIVMCEDIKDYAPANAAVVFSLAIGKVYCYSAFNPVPRKMTIYHSWYRRDRLITSRRLTLEPPQWATFSTIQLREPDKGPWRVEIRDADNNLLHVTRFSITD